MSIKYNERGEVVSVNGLTTGHHIGAPMQDAVAKKPEDNLAYSVERNIIARNNVENDDEQPALQPDFAQNDPTKPDYVKNRTHYEEVTQESIEGVELSWNIGQDHDTIPFELGQTWDFYLYNSRSGNWINWNYSGANDEGHYPVQQATDGTFYIGEPNVNDLPFYITTTSSALNGSFENMNNATKLKIVGASGTRTISKAKTLDEKFMPLDMVVELDVSGDEPVGKIISGTFEACKQKIENDIPARVKVIEKGVGYKAVVCFEFVLMTQDSNEALWAHGFETEFVVLADGTVEFF